MPLLLLDARSGLLREPPPGAFTIAFAGEWRARSLSGPILSICAHLGLAASRASGPEADVLVSSRPPEGSRGLWLKLGAAEAPPQSHAQAAQWLCWKTAYGAPLCFGPGDLEAAERELAWVRARRGELAGAPAANDSALSGYLQRLRQALAQDLGTPEAFACLSAALRPGALSPGTQAAFLRRVVDIFPVS